MTAAYGYAEAHQVVYGSVPIWEYPPAATTLTTQ
jgi:hypothetical protein